MAASTDRSLAQECVPGSGRREGRVRARGGIPDGESGLIPSRGEELRGGRVARTAGSSIRAGVLHPRAPMQHMVQHGADAMGACDERDARTRWGTPEKGRDGARRADAMGARDARDARMSHPACRSRRRYRHRHGFRPRRSLHRAHVSRRCLGALRGSHDHRVRTHVRPLSQLHPRPLAAGLERWPWARATR